MAEFPVAVTGIVTRRGKILVGKKKGSDSPGEEWRLPGGRLKEDGDLEETLKQNIEEETGLEVEVHQIVDAYFDEDTGSLEAVYHCEAEGEAEPLDMEEVRWVQPGDLEQELGENAAQVFSERERMEDFREKLEKMPTF
ncbi:MAG: NUDIX domain-containing protein [Candidatus Nanohaloarchaea archaeon]